MASDGGDAAAAGRGGGSGHGEPEALVAAPDGSSAARRRFSSEGEGLGVVGPDRSLPFAWTNRTSPPGGVPMSEGLKELQTGRMAGCEAPFLIGEVVPGMYRSGHPTPSSLEFVKRMGLTSIVSLYDPEPAWNEYGAFLEECGIRKASFKLKGNRKTPYDMDWDVASDAISFMADARNHPVMTHCRSGKHRTGCLIAVARRLQGWTSDRAYAEYAVYCTPKEREVDKQFIELFDLGLVVAKLPDEEHVARWVSRDIMATKGRVSDAV